VAVALACFGPGAASAQQVTKRALIVAVGDYGPPPVNPATGQPVMGYKDLSSANDVVLVRGALERQGFLPRDIHVLPDSLATAAGLRSALQRLVRDTGRGDVVVIHYSGHGDKFTNDNPAEDEEIDGYDEVLAVYGSPAMAWEGYDGSLHVRDDELGAFIAQIRARAGRTGNVTVFLDACYSGTGTRGPEDELPVRGGETLVSPPAFTAGRVAATRGGSDADRGTGIELSVPATTRGEVELAPFVVISAASPRQMAKETYDVDGRTKVGSLSYAIARALPEAGPGTTNRALFATIVRSLVGKVSNQTPQIEGDADRDLFSNRLALQDPYVVVDSVVGGGVALASGTLVGLNPGTRLSVHPLGTATAGRGTPLATLEVTEASPTRSLARILSGAVADGDRGAWAFVTLRAYGDLALRVKLDSSLRDTDRVGLARSLMASGMVSLADESAQVVVRAGDGGTPEARVIGDDRLLATGAQALEDSVEVYARSWYMRRLAFEHPELDFDLELSPRPQVMRPPGQRPYCAPADWAATEARPENLGGGQWRLAPGDTYWVRATNRSRRPAYVYLLEFSPAGRLGVLRPAQGESVEQVLPGASATWCFGLGGEDLGQAVLKLFATEASQDLRPWFQPPRTRSGRTPEPDRAVTRELIIDIQPN
jgi:hypothetical protein